MASQGRRRFGAGFGWRLAALAVAGLLVVLVTVARLGMPVPRPATADLASPSQLLATVVPTPTAPAPVAPEASVLVTVRQVRLLSDTPFARTGPWSNRFADGIPSSIDGTPVHRVNDTIALAFSAASEESPSILIGGWYAAETDVDPKCGPVRTWPTCQVGKIADSPLQLSNYGVSVEGVSVSQNEPIVIRGVARTRCNSPIDDGLARLCSYTISAQDLVWRGDEFTSAGPISVAPLLQQLAARYGGFDPEPYHDLPSCLLPRPAQGYRSDAGLVQYIFIFPTTADRFANATALLNGPPYGDIASGCEERPPLDGKSGWVSVENVMVRISGYTDSSALELRSLLEAVAAGGTT